MNKYIGIDIGGTTVKLAVITELGEIIERWEIPTQIINNGQEIPTDIINSIKSKKVIDETVKGVGCGVPGPISIDGKIVVQAVNLGWMNLNLKAKLEEGLKLPACLINDANAAALGEYWVYQYEGVKNILFVTLGTGVGGGLIVNGEVINGANSSGGEIGHIPVMSSEERICGCGNINCLETYASATGLITTMEEILSQENIERDSFSAKEIFIWATEGDQLAKRAVNITIKYLGMAIAGILNTFDPSVVIIGGGLSQAGEELLKPLRKQVNHYAFPAIRGGYEIFLAKLGNDAGMLGAVYNVIREIQ